MRAVEEPELRRSYLLPEGHRARVEQVTPTEWLNPSPSRCYREVTPTEWPRASREESSASLRLSMNDPPTAVGGIRPAGIVKNR